MIKHGEQPFLECSTKGDKRFSAFCAKLKVWNGRTIEDIYQCSKIINGKPVTHWRLGKGKRPDNLKYCNWYYARLWDIYIKENPNLIGVLINQTGLSDVFGQPGHCCQATELWRIRLNILGLE